MFPRIKNARAARVKPSGAPGPSDDPRDRLKSQVDLAAGEIGTGASDPVPMVRLHLREEPTDQAQDAHQQSRRNIRGQRGEREAGTVGMDSREVKAKETARSKHRLDRARGAPRKFAG